MWSCRLDGIYTLQYWWGIKPSLGRCRCQCQCLMIFCCWLTGYVLCWINYIMHYIYNFTSKFTCAFLLFHSLGPKNLIICVVFVCRCIWIKCLNYPSNTDPRCWHCWTMESAAKTGRLDMKLETWNTRHKTITDPRASFWRKINEHFIISCRTLWI